MELMPHQSQAVGVCLNQRATLVAFDIGTGKTAIGVSSLHPTQQNIIGCPASLVKNWEAELKLWNCQAKKVKVVSYNKLKWNDDCHTLILDEAHLLKNPMANRTINARQLAYRAKKIVALTATPILNKYQELVNIMELIGISSDESTQVENLLKKQLLIRVKLQDVVDLPKPTFKQTAVELTDTEAIKQTQQEINDLYLESDSDFEKCWRDYRMELVGKLSKIRRHVGVAKTKDTMDIIQKQIEDNPGEQFLVFAHHKTVIEALAATFDAPVISGSKSLVSRNETVNEFQAGKHRMIICSIQAAGVGLTLTNAKKVFFVELPYTPAAVEQAYGRAYRKGQTDSVQVNYLMSDHIIDQRCLQILENKKEICSVLNVSSKQVLNMEKTLIKDLLLVENEEV